MRIESVKQSEKRPGRFIVTLESGVILRAGIEQIADYSLYAGRELDDGELAELQDNLAQASARVRALRILGTRSMSRREITRRLIEKGEDADVADDTADWLEAQGFINDAEYAQGIVRHYKQRGYGPARIRNELSRRGIARELWDDAFCPDDDVDETDDAVYNYIDKRLQGALPDRAEHKRIVDALFRRGFAWEDIKSAMRRYLEENGE